MKEQVLRLIEEARAPMTARRLSEALEAPLEETQAAIDALASEGQIAPTRKGGWAVPAAIGLMAARAAFQRRSMSGSCFLR